MVGTGAALYMVQGDESGAPDDGLGSSTSSVKEVDVSLLQRSGWQRARWHHRGGNTVAHVAATQRRLNSTSEIKSAPLPPPPPHPLPPPPHPPPPPHKCQQHLQAEDANCGYDVSKPKYQSTRIVYLQVGTQQSKVGIRNQPAYPKTLTPPQRCAGPLMWPFDSPLALDTAHSPRRPTSA